MRQAIYGGVQKVADALWHAARAFDRMFPEGILHPKWAPAPLAKQRQKSFPTFGFPRETDSLCPRCVTEVRTQILSGDVDWKVLIEGNPGEIKARIVEEDGRILMKKDCPKHGHFEDVMSTDPAFFKRLESLYPGRDFVIPEGWAPRARDVIDQVRPRSGPHDRPDQPLQHDVRPVLHGRQPGRLRPRARMGGRQEAARRRGLDPAAPPAFGAVLGRRADSVPALPAGRSSTRARSATSPSSAPPTASASRRTRASRRRRRRPGCASPTCSSTGSATSTTSTARSATSSTSSSAPSRIFTSTASTSRWSRRSSTA